MADKSFAVRIADIVIRVDSTVGIDHFNDIGFYRNFMIRPGSGAHCRLKVVIAPPPHISAVTRPFSPRGNWQLSRSKDKNILQIGPPPKRGDSENLTIFNSGYTVGRVYQKSATEVFQGFLDQFLIINLLSKRRGFLLHSSGVVLEGKGACFIGQSGAGKSTLLRLFRDEVAEKHLLNDDKLALRRQGRRWRVFGTPWHGEFPVASQSGADLKALFFIKQSKRNYLSRLSTGDALRRLVAQAIIPLWDEEASAKVIDSFASLLDEIPSFELGFLPDKRVLKLIKKAL